MNISEAKMSIVLEAYQKTIHSILKRYDTESDAKERDKLLARVYNIIEAIQGIK